MPLPPKKQIEQRLRQVRTEEQDIKERTELLLQLQAAGSPEKNAASTGWRRYAMPTTNSAFRA